MSSQLGEDCDEVTSNCQATHCHRAHKNGKDVAHLKTCDLFKELPKQKLMPEGRIKMSMPQRGLLDGKIQLMRQSGLLARDRKH